MTSEDQLLIDRIRPVLESKPGYSERNMFGSVCFMIHGNMCAGTWKGSLIVRLDKQRHEETLSAPHTRPADMNGRVMSGWALVDPEGIDTEADLECWLEKAVKFAESLPAK